MENMTALVSAFARAYHYRNNTEWVFADYCAGEMLTEEEYDGISRSMSEGISYFAPGFSGPGEEALRFIVDHQLAPSVLARGAFCEREIDIAVRNGCRQIVLFACGYDSFSVRSGNRDLKVFELDRPQMIADKQKRILQSGLQAVCRVEYIGCDLSGPGWRSALLKAGFQPEAESFGSLLGISYYLSKKEFRDLLGSISSAWSEGSVICFDYPAAEGGTESKRNLELAAAAGEQMKALYSGTELETMLSETGFMVREHLNASGADEAFFQKYNRKHPEHSMKAPDGVGYCLAVRKQPSVP